MEFKDMPMFQNNLGGESVGLWTRYWEVVCLSWRCPYFVVHNLGQNILEFCRL